jgi:transposase
MLGYQPPPQDKLFYTGISLEGRVRKDHPLRQIEKLVDFDFIYDEVRDRYGRNGNVSAAPPVILKLMETLPERLDWLWFLGYDLDTEIPNHSVLSKARRKWGAEAFRKFFERLVWQCVTAGLVDGGKIFVDASLVRADASMNSVVDAHSLRRHLDRSYRELQKRMDKPLEKAGEVNGRYISTTDPEASILRRGGSKLRYKTHRAADPSHEVITATDVTTGVTNEAHTMKPLMDSHQDNTGKKAETVVADSKYGTIENYLECCDGGVKAHIPDMNKRLRGSGSRKGIFPESKFEYDEETDTYACPAGRLLRPGKAQKGRKRKYYLASGKDCLKCEFKPKCTQNKSGKKLNRHVRQRELEAMRSGAGSAESKRDIMTRQHLMERSFARAKRHGHGRARWRGLWRVRIQEYLTAAVQNIQILIKHAKGRARGVAMARRTERMARTFPIIRACLSLVFEKLPNAIKVQAAPGKFPGLMPLSAT